LMGCVVLRSAGSISKARPRRGLPLCALRRGLGGHDLHGLAPTMQLP